MLFRSVVFGTVCPAVLKHLVLPFLGQGGGGEPENWELEHDAVGFLNGLLLGLHVDMILA